MRCLALCAVLTMSLCNAACEKKGQIPKPYVASDMRGQTFDVPGRGGRGENEEAKR